MSRTKWKEQGFIFTKDNGDMIGLYAPTEMCSQYEERCGLRHLKLYGLRHTCGSLLANNGADLETVNAVFGHESIRTTEQYLTPYDESKRKAAELIADAEAVIPMLNRLLGFESREELPHIRSIRGAVAELKERTVNIGIGEKMIRSAVKDGRIPCIRIGNREYIAMQSFDEPYCNRIFEKTAPVASRTETIKRDVMAQMAEVLASNLTVPTVVRVRRAS